MTDLLIIGAGPVGLKTAIEAKLRSPDLDVLMIEQYPHYKRRHVLSIDKATFKNSFKDAQYQALLNECVGALSTEVLENKLKEKALSLGIKIKYQKIESCQSLAQQYPKTKLIIAADGARSVVRQQVFKETMKHKASLQYVAEMKYWVEGNTRALSKFTECPLALTKGSHLIVEHVGKPVSNRTPVTLRAFINQAEHESVKQATFKQPYRWDEQDKAKIAPKLIQSLEYWLEYRKKQLHDCIDHSSTNMTGLTLGSYASQNTVKNKFGTTWALVGDAAFGVPYFRSLNNGFLCADVLAKQSVRHLNGERDIEKQQFLGLTISEKSHSPLKQYQSYAHKLSDQEILHAQLKAKGLQAAQIPLAASRKIASSAQKIETKHVLGVGALMLTMYGMKRYYDSKKVHSSEPGAKLSNRLRPL